MQQKWLLAFRVLGLGWYVGTAILLGVLGGVWLDDELGTRPLFIVVGLLLGLVAAVYGAVKMLLPMVNNTNREKKKN